MFSQQPKLLRKFIVCWTYLIRFLKNPVKGMAELPDWDWPLLISFHLVLSAALGFFSGFLSFRITVILAGLFVLPLSSLLIVFVLSGFFYYTFLFFFHREIDFKKLVTLIIFVSIPYLLLNVIVHFVPPISLLAALASGILLIVGLSDLTKIDRLQLMKIVAGIFALYAVFWISQQISNSREPSRFKRLATPESIDILEKELSD